MLRGASHPRVEVRPPGVADDFGAEAADLMARAGKPLYEWQRDSVQLLLSIRDDGRWACVEYAEIVARQNGKGGVLEARVLAGFLLLGERLIMWSAHEVKTASEAFIRIKELLQALDPRPDEEKAADPNFILVDGDVPVKISEANGQEGFKRLDTGQRIRFIARSKGSGRGFSGDLNIIDETFAYTGAQHAALFPTMLARPNPQIIYTSTPPLSPDSGEVMHTLRARAKAVLEALAALGNHGGDDRFGFRDWGLEGDLDNLDQVDLDDPRLWARVNPSLGHSWMTLEILAIARRTLPLLEFAREVLCIWPRAQDNAGAIDANRWAALRDPESRRVGEIALGVDISPDREWAVIAFYGVRADGVGHLQLLDYRPGTDWVIERLALLRQVLRPIGIGMGKGTYASLENALRDNGFTVPEDPDKPRRGQVLVLDYLDMSAGCSQMLDAVKHSRLRHVGDDPLDKAVAAAKVRQTTDSVVWARKQDKAKNDIGPLVAGTEAKYVHETWLGIVVDDDYDPLDSIA
ncbi:hypothetical protein [Saccharothrix lopnurensis]|uniref:Phage terminase large subunit-like protein n=1 Tax=Saccharothrix lopnurensis TaxID=1670621 RepID=A0ABW1P1Z9_9PSEU